MFFLIHNEIKGPEIKSSYYTNPVNLSKEFISKLYMSHAGFESSSHIEIKFEDYQSISCFTGNLDRRSQKEGILGIIFEENEVFGNLDLFLQRNLYAIVEKPDNETIEEIFKNKLLNYLELDKLFAKVEIEDISEIFLITGDHEFKSCLLKIGDNRTSNIEIGEMYPNILQQQEIPEYQYVELIPIGSNNMYLILKTVSESKNINKIISTLKPYLEKYPFYALEILTLFLLPSYVKLIPLNLNLSKTFSDKNKSVLESLKKAENYSEEFDKIISHLVIGDIYLLPIL